MDIAGLVVTLYPSFVGKKSVASYPVVGSIVTALDSIFIERATTKEAKIEALKSI